MNDTCSAKNVDISEYEVVVKKNKVGFILSIPELCLFVKSSEISSGFDNLVSEFEKLKLIYIESESLKEFPKPRKQTHRDIQNSTGIFAAKFLIAIATIVCLGYAGSVIVTHKINQISVGSLLKKQAKEIAGLADHWNNIDTARKDEILTDIRDVYISIKPLLNSLSTHDTN